MIVSLAYMNKRVQWTLLFFYIFIYNTFSECVICGYINNTTKRLLFCGITRTTINYKNVQCTFSISTRLWLVEMFIVLVRDLDDACMYRLGHPKIFSYEKICWAIFRLRNIVRAFERNTFKS